MFFSKSAPPKFGLSKASNRFKFYKIWGFNLENLGQKVESKFVQDCPIYTECSFFQKLH